MKTKIAVLGSLNYDCVAYGKRLPAKGETIIGHGNGFYFGGKGGNQAVQAARLGAEVYFIGRVGNDDIGEKMLTSLKKEGINTDYVVVDNESASGTCCIMVDDNGENSIMVAPNANLRVSRQDIDDAMSAIKQCDVLLTQLEVTIDAIEYAIIKAGKAGVKVVLDPAPACKLNREIYEYVDYITPNESEAQIITGLDLSGGGDDSLSKTAKRLLGLGVKNVLLTLGSKGVFFADNTKSLFVSPYKIDAADSTAAGDAFNGGFAVKLAQGADIVEAIKYGSAAGAVAATKKGAQTSLSTKDEIERFIINNS